MLGAIERGPELKLIVSLCRELAKLGLNVCMSDARPAALIHGPVLLPVTVDRTAECFVYGDGQNQYRHPAADPAGAARLIRLRVVSCRTAKGGLS